MSNYQVYEDCFTEEQIEVIEAKKAIIRDNSVEDAAFLLGYAEDDIRQMKLIYGYEV